MPTKYLKNNWEGMAEYFILGFFFLLLFIDAST